jgi:kynurenine formamidase
MRRSSDIARGDPYNVIELRFTTHLLTHLDAPRHFFPEGDAVDEIPPERFVGEALVLEVKGPAVLPELPGDPPKARGDHPTFTHPQYPSAPNLPRRDLPCNCSRRL